MVRIAFSCATIRAIALGLALAVVSFKCASARSDWYHNFDEGLSGLQFGHLPEQSPTFRARVEDGKLVMSDTTTVGEGGVSYAWFLEWEDFTDVRVSAEISGDNVVTFWSRIVQGFHGYTGIYSFGRHSLRVSKSVGMDQEEILSEVIVEPIPASDSLFLEFDVVDEASGEPRLTARLFDQEGGDLLATATGVDESLTPYRSGDSLFGVWAPIDGSMLAQFDDVSVAAIPEPLMAGDADEDLDFDQLDLVQVQVAAKYLTARSATWGEGDWNGAPGGSVGSPPTGDGFFDQLDIVAAQQAGIYLTGPYATILPSGQAGDGQTSVVYNATTGEVAVDAPVGIELTSINIDSAAGIFTGDPAQNVEGSFDTSSDDNIFKATFGTSFGSLSFGTVAQPGLPQDLVANDLTVVGSLAGGGGLGDVDLIYVIPEPTALVLLTFGLIGIVAARRR